MQALFQRIKKIKINEKNNKKKSIKKFNKIALLNKNDKHFVAVNNHKKFKFCTH